MFWRSKKLWLDGFIKLNSILSAKELSDLQEVMRDKELNLRTDIYEILLQEELISWTVFDDIFLRFFVAQLCRHHVLFSLLLKWWNLERSKNVIPEVASCFPPDIGNVGHLKGGDCCKLYIGQKDLE